MPERDQNACLDRFLIEFETWVEHLPALTLEIEAIGSSAECRLRHSITGLPVTEGLPETTNALGGNITDMDVINDLEDFNI